MRPIPGWPGYHATVDGRIIGKQGHALRPRQHWRTGHLRVRLFGPQAPPVAIKVGDSIQLSRFADVYVHVLVALAYHGPGLPGQLVRHWNDDPEDNRPENLIWGTRLENAADVKRNAVDGDGFNWETGESER